MKKTLLALITTLLISQSTYSAPVFNNSTRELFAQNKANVYVMNMRTFSAQDKDRNEIIDRTKGEKSGTFLGAIKRLDSLEEAGINVIHLLPITPVGKLKAIGTAGSLYALDDFSSINPQLDDLDSSLTVYEEAKQFFEECHKRNIKVIVDLPSCGSYDMFLRHPELFVLDKDGNSVLPADWTDVRLFKTVNTDGSLNQELFYQHKLFIDMMQRLGADGIRADVATIKPYIFWKNLIDYSRKNNPDFFFLAEASPEWTTPISQDAPFTPYDKLLEAGFDAYLGNYMNFDKFTNVNDLFKAPKQTKELSEKYNSQKSLILNFATHDDISPMLTSENWARQIIWLSSLLPGNTYFVNGFHSGDYYLYNYSGKKADLTYTDDSYYHTHKGKLDIFNFSRQPGSTNKDLNDEFVYASTFKSQFADFINTAHMTTLKTSNKQILAFEYGTESTRLIVALNPNKTLGVTGNINLKGVNEASELTPVKMGEGKAKFEKGKLKVTLAPSDIFVFIKVNKFAPTK